jgi:Sucrose synthase
MHQPVGRLMQCAYALQAPDDDTLASFLGGLPMMFSIAILSPHGFFGQSGEHPSV